MKDKGLPTPEDEALEAMADERIRELRVLGEALSSVEGSPSFSLRFENGVALESQFGDKDPLSTFLVADGGEKARLDLLIARRLLGKNSKLLDMTPQAIGDHMLDIMKDGVYVNYKQGDKWLTIAAPTIIPGLQYRLRTETYAHSDRMFVLHSVANQFAG